MLLLVLCLPCRLRILGLHMLTVDVIACPERFCTMLSYCRYHTTLVGDHIIFAVSRKRAGVTFGLLYDHVFQRCRKQLRPSSEASSWRNELRCYISRSPARTSAVEGCGLDGGFIRKIVMHMICLKDRHAYDLFAVTNCSLNWTNTHARRFLSKICLKGDQWTWYEIYTKGDCEFGMVS
jgi:hypothetical protein